MTTGTLAAIEVELPPCSVTDPIEFPEGLDVTLDVPPTVPDDTADPDEPDGFEAAPGGGLDAEVALKFSQAVGIGALPPSPRITPDPNGTDGMPANLVGVCLTDPPNTLMIMRRTRRTMKMMRASFMLLLHPQQKKMIDGGLIHSFRIREPAGRRL